MSDWRWTLDFLGEIATLTGVNMTEIKHLRGDSVHTAVIDPAPALSPTVIDEIADLENTLDVKLKSHSKTSGKNGKRAKGDRLVITFTDQ